MFFRNKNSRLTLRHFLTFSFHIFKHTTSLMSSKFKKQNVIRGLKRAKKCHVFLKWTLKTKDTTIDVV